MRERIWRLALIIYRQHIRPFFKMTVEQDPDYIPDILGGELDLPRKADISPPPRGPQQTIPTASVWGQEDLLDMITCIDPYVPLHIHYWNKVELPYANYGAFNHASVRPPDLSVLELGRRAGTMGSHLRTEPLVRHGDRGSGEDTP